MRISDWSSDVCSSDLGSAGRPAGPGRRPRGTNGPPPRPPWSSAARGSSRSEEHTSELQSLMRISYAVFCLRKKRLHTQDEVVAEYHRTYSQPEHIIPQYNTHYGP